MHVVPAIPGTLRALHGPAPSTPRTQTKPGTPQDEGAGRPLRCAACGHPITHDDARTEVAGSHEHTFFNPHGVLFRIGCFREAPGARLVGERTTDFTWFAGHTWQIALCGQCGQHLGWRFEAANACFHGLIQDRLVPG